MVQPSLNLVHIELRMKNGFGRPYKFQTFGEANQFLYNYNAQAESAAYEHITYRVMWEDNHSFSDILMLPFNRGEGLLLQNIIRDILYDRLYLVFPSGSLQWLGEYFLCTRPDHQEYDTLLSRGEGFDHEHYKRTLSAAKRYMEGLYKTYPGLRCIYKRAQRFSAFSGNLPYRSMKFKRYLLDVAKKYVRMALDMCFLGRGRMAREYIHKLSLLSQEVYAERLVQDERFTKQGAILYGIFLGENRAGKALSEAELIDFSCRINAVRSTNSYHQSTSYARGLFYLVYSEVFDRMLQEEKISHIYDQTSVEVARRLISNNTPVCSVIELINRYDPFAVGRPNYGKDIFQKIYPDVVIKPSIAVQESL